MYEPPSLLEGKKALHHGLSLLTENHCIQTFTQNKNQFSGEMEIAMRSLKHYYYGSVDANNVSFPASNDLILSLALQLSNISIELAFEEILENQTKQLWKDASPPYFFSLPLKEHTVQSKCEGDQKDDPQSILFGDEEDIEFMELLDNIDFHIESELETTTQLLTYRMNPISRICPILK